MAQQQDTPATSLAPRLVAPREEAVINGKEVTFVWMGNDAITGYTLQVAADRLFEDVVFEKEVGYATSFTVSGRFITDDRTYFWRVFGLDKQGRWHGEEIIESFISGTREDVALHTVSPDRREELGPVAELFRATSVEAAAEVTGAPEYFEQEAQMGVAHEGIEAGQIIAIALAILVSLGIIAVIVMQWTSIVAIEVQRASVGMSGYPELRENKAEAVRLLNQYDVVEGEPGQYRIPIERAIDLMVNEAYGEQGRTYSSELPLRPNE